MGFHTKVIILSQTQTNSGNELDFDTPEFDSEEGTVVWEDSSLRIDFGHITRLEKITGERFRHLHHSAFRRAGICVVDCFLDHLYEDLENSAVRRFAPEILVNGRFPVKGSTTLLASKQYVSCSEYVLSGTFDLVDDINGVVARHNKAVGSDEATLQYALSRWMILDPPFFWASCKDMSDWLEEAESQKSEAWTALDADRLSLALVRSWQCLLREVGETGARALFRFY